MILGRVYTTSTNLRTLLPQQGVSTALCNRKVPLPQQAARGPRRGGGAAAGVMTTAAAATAPPPAPKVQPVIRWLHLPRP
jgi:hypothetical protein